MQHLTVGAALLATLAVWLLVPGPTAGGGAPPGHGWRASRGVWLAVGAAAGALLVVAEGTALALGLILLGAATATWRLARSASARKVADARADRVVELCEALAGELRAGQPPVRALRHGVEVWAELEPAATAADLGADVPGALRRLGGLAGASGMQEVAAAWQVSEGSGATLSLALSRVADSARDRRAAQRLVASELASAQATARLVAALPVLVLVLGSGVGGDPWGFLLRTPVGLGALAGGLVMAFAGLAWIGRIGDSAVTG